MAPDNENEMEKHFDSSFRRDIAKVIILNLLRKRKSHPYAILTSIRKMHSPIARELTKSDLYNLIASLENGGFISSRVSVSGARAKKVYGVTAKGDRVARNAKRILLRHILAMKKLVTEEFHE